MSSKKDKFGGTPVTGKKVDNPKRTAEEEKFGGTPVTHKQGNSNTKKSLIILLLSVCFYSKPF